MDAEVFFIFGPVALLLIVCWLVAEWRPGNRGTRIALGLVCILMVSFVTHGSQGRLYFHKFLLIEIDRALEKGGTDRVRHALSTYESRFKPKQDFMEAAYSAYQELNEANFRAAQSQ